MTVDGSENDWLDSGSLRLVADHINPEGPPGIDGNPREATPIDLPTVKFIYEQWANILGAEGITDEAAADIFGGYISGLMQGLKGDFDD